MQAITQATRAVMYYACSGIDFEQVAQNAEDAQHYASRTSLLTPIAKAWASELAQEVCYIAVQVHGGMGL